MSFTAIIQAAQLIPAAINIIKTLEENLPGAGRGAEKLEALRSLLASVYSASQAASTAFDELWPLIQSAVAAIVVMFNRLGVFKKSTPTT